MWMSVLPLIAATCRRSGTAGVGGGDVTVVGAQWTILPTLVIPIAILGVTLRQHPQIGQLYRALYVYGAL